MTRLDILASLVMDACNQQYSKQSDFFKQEDYTYYCSIFYHQVLQEEFEKQKRIAEKNQMYGNLDITLSDSWYRLKEFDVEKKDGYYVVNLTDYISFSNDPKSTSIKRIFITEVGANESCCETVAKITVDEVRTLKFLSKSDKTIYTYVVGDQLILRNYSGNLDKVKILYIPTLDSEAEPGEIVVPGELSAEIVTRTYNFMTSAKQGSVVDKTNNQNSNKVIQTEIDATNG